MGGFDFTRGGSSIAEARERIYGFLAAILSHPDEGRWGRAIAPKEQQLAILAADRLRAAAQTMDYPLLPHEQASSALDLRFLVLELCQPLEHLRGVYERVLCSRRPRAGCSPYELHHRPARYGYTLAESLADLALMYRGFGLFQGASVPLRPDHIAFELEFMRWLLAQTRLVTRLTRVDTGAAELAFRCDLAQRGFFGDHLATWVSTFAARLHESTGGGYLGPLGRFLAAWIPLERHHLDVEPHDDCLSPSMQVSLAT